MRCARSAGTCVWLAGVIGRIGNHPACNLNQLLPWHGRIVAAVAGNSDNINAKLARGNRAIAN